jgi:hypothetical protein
MGSRDVAATRRPCFPEPSGLTRTQMAEEAVDMTNEGTADRVIRVVIGLGLLSIVFVGPQTPWGWIGVVPLLTGIVGFCPLYAILRLSTAPARR